MSASRVLSDQDKPQTDWREILLYSFLFVAQLAAVILFCILCNKDERERCGQICSNFFKGDRGTGSTQTALLAPDADAGPGAAR